MPESRDQSLSVEHRTRLYCMGQLSVWTSPNRKLNYVYRRRKAFFHRVDMGVDPLGLHAEAP